MENYKCGAFVENRHAGKLQVGKYRNALKWRGTRNQLGRWKNVSEDFRLDEHARVYGCRDWNYFRRGWNICGKDFLLFGLLGNWISCGHMEYFRLGKIRAD